MSGITRLADPSVAFFNERADAYSREYDDQTPGGYALRVRREKVLQLFDQPGGKVLDVGCGPGPMAQEIVSRGCSYWGVDPAEKMLEIGRRRFMGNQSVHFLLGDAMHLALPDGFFDAVLCMGVIDGLRDRRQALSEMFRVLKPGGTLIITFTNPVSPYSWWKKYIFYPAVVYYQELRGDRRPGRRRRATPTPDARERVHYNKSAACRLLQSEGAEVTRILGYYFNVFLSPLDEFFPGVALWVTRKLEEGRWPRPEWFASGWIIKAKKWM